MYVFQAINGGGKREISFDESRTLLDLDPFVCILSLKERTKEKPDEQIQSNIRKIIGKCMLLNTNFLIKFCLTFYYFTADLQELKSSEVTDFRWKMKNFVDHVVHERENKTWLEKVLCKYPPRISLDTRLPSLVNGDTYAVSVKFHDSHEVVLKNYYCSHRY
jgi:uncharacterized protein YifE (UPF0438 family)